MSPSNANNAVKSTSSLRGRVLYGVSASMFGRFLAIGAMFAVNAVLAHHPLGDAELSAYLLATFLVPFVSHFVNMGATDVLHRVIRRSHLKNDVRLARRGGVACFQIFFVNGIVCSVLLVIACGMLAEGRPQWSELRGSSLWLVAWILLFSACQIVAEFFRAKDRFLTSTAIFTTSGGWLANALILTAVAVASMRGEANLALTLQIHVAAMTVALITGACLVVPLLRPSAVAEAPSLNELAAAQQGAGAIPEHPTVRWLLRETWPIYVWAGTLLCIEQADVFVVSFISSDASVVDYGLAKRCLAIMNVGFVTLGQALMPFVSELYERGDLRRLERMLRGAATLIGLPCLALSALLFVGADYFVELAFGAGRTGVATPFRILLVGQVFLFLAGHANIVLLMSGRQRELMRSTLVVGAAYAALLPIAIFSWDMIGAAVARSLATVERAVAAAVIARRTVGVRTTASFSRSAIHDAVELLLKRRRPEVVGEEVATILES